MILIDVRVFLEHVQVIRSNIGPESVEKCRDVHNETIWANFREKAKGIPLGLFFQTSRYFFEIDNCIFKTLYNYQPLHGLKSIQIFFFYILKNIKYSSYDCISESQKNQLFIKYFSMDLQKLKIIFTSWDTQLINT
jgi:hypothetical protein